MNGKLPFSYENCAIVGTRLDELFKGLDKKETMASVEDFIDEYTNSVFGVSVMGELRKVKLPGGGNPTCIQTLIKGRAVLISAYGFKVKSECECKCGRGFLVLDEENDKDHEQAMASLW